MELTKLSNTIHIIKPNLDETTMTKEQWLQSMKKVEQSNKHVETTMPEKVWPLRLNFLERLWYYG